jgi:2-haloacid dehalogenase
VNGDSVLIRKEPVLCGRHVHDLDCCMSAPPRRRGNTVSGIRTVVFDVGGVLIDGDYRLLGRKLFERDAEVDFFLDEVLGAEFHLERDRGALMAETAAEWSRRHPDYASVIHDFCDRFPEMWRGPVLGSPELLGDLRVAGVGVYGLTNWGRETWPLVCEHFPFLTSLDGVLVSAEVGLTKPDPEIFRLFCARFGVAPDEAVFVDDVVENVTAARSFGFRGIDFTNVDELRNELIRCGALDQP